MIEVWGIWKCGQRKKIIKLLYSLLPLLGGVSSGIIANAIKNYILGYINEFNRDISTINQLISLGIIIALSISLAGY